MIGRFVILLISAGIANAQSSTSSILGLVRDSSGAVITNARVVATQTETNRSYETSTTAEGYYRIPFLPVGPYRVQVEAPGFNKGTSNLQQPLQVDEQLRIDFDLTPGSVTEAITVEAQAQTVDTSQAAVRHVVDSYRMVELPLNGREMIDLLLLTPGVIRSSGGGGVQSPEVGYSVNGGRGTTTNYLMDGGDNNDYFTNTASFYPIPDAIQEFSVQANSFSAEYGRAAGGVVNVVTKSGTNELHGNLFEFLRNDALNTRNFFSVGKPMLRQHQFGGTVGGPLTIPRLYRGKDRTFIFLSYQATRIRSAPTSSNVIVPTAAERRGDFSASTVRVRDPLTGQQFPDNRIPAARLDPITQRFLDGYVPLPNLAGGQLSLNNVQEENSDQGVIRIDHSLSDTHKIYGRSLNQVNRSTDVDRLPAFRNRLEFRSWNVTFGDSWIVRPTLVNQLTLTMNRTASLPGAVNSFRWRDLGVRVPLAGPESDPTSTQLNVTGAFGFTQRVALMLPRTIIHGNESISFNRGQHFLRAGFEFRHLQEIRRTNNQLDGFFAFSGQFSLAPTSDFLLGLPSSYAQAGNVQEGLARNVGLGWYVQDDWKLNPRLTLNLGVRLEPYFPIVDQRNRRPVFRAGRQSTIFPTAPLGMVWPGDEGVPRGTVENQWNKWAPRFGLAWDVTGKGRTSIRLGYGIFYDNPSTVQNNGFGGQPYSFAYTINGPQSFANPFGSIQPVIPYFPPATAQERATFRFVTPTVLLGLDTDFTSGYNQQYNLNIEQALPAAFKITVAYVGMMGIHLPIVRQVNPATFRAGATVANTDARRIYAPNFQDIGLFSPAATSNYNALQTTLNRRFSSGFTLLASYTFAKSIDVGSDSRLNAGSNPIQNPFNLRAEHAVSDYDAKHGFVASLVWQVPLFRNSRGLVAAVLGGWQLSHIANLRSGTPVNVVSGRDNTLSGINKDRPNVVGSPAMPDGRPRGTQIAEFFNRAAFVQNPAGVYGNAGRNVLRGPARKNFDIALSKSFRIRERWQAQFRMESFNAFNFVNLGNPGGNLNAATYGRITTAEEGRIFQAAIKLQW